MHGWYVLRNDLTALETDGNVSSICFVSTATRSFATKFDTCEAARLAMNRVKAEWPNYKLAVVYFP